MASSLRTLQWMDVPDSILGDLAKRFLMRKPLKSATFTNEKERAATIAYLRELIEKVGFNPKYTAINSSYDLPYDFIVQIKTVIVHKLN